MRGSARDPGSISLKDGKAVSDAALLALGAARGDKLSGTLLTPFQGVASAKRLLLAFRTYY